jgi:hypothetical protein
MATENHTAAKARQSSLQPARVKAPSNGGKRGAPAHWPPDTDACNEASCELDQARGVVDTLIELAVSGDVESLGKQSLANTLFSVLGSIERARDLINGYTAPKETSADARSAAGATSEHS